MSKYTKNPLTCDVYLGVVHVGATLTKSCPIKNNYNDVVSFHVTRNSKTNPIYHVFDVNKYQAEVAPGEDFNLRVTYSPNIAGSKDYDYFSITDSKHNFYCLIFRGECIGPSIQCSIKNLTFFKTPKRKIHKHIFSLRNTTKVCAYFQFDWSEEKHGIFTVEPLKGVLTTQKEEYITVRFHPEECNFYSRQLCCLILHHEPIIINLFGLSASTNIYDSDNLSYKFYPFTLEETVGFNGYLSDSVTLKKIPPPFSLTVNYLDFGKSPPENSCQILTTSFTNHLENPVRVEWENVSLFKIYPKKLEVPAKQSALYELRFVPDFPETIAAANVNGHVIWSLFDPENRIPVPIPINMRFIGHSFQKNRWIPSISIEPNNIILPLSLPNYTTYTTFMIKAQGHLPVLYKLIPPLKTNFIMKPMVGLIRVFQIITVQLESSSNEPTSYVEKWGIALNGTVEKSTAIYVKAQTDTPRVLLGDDNVIDFGTLQPGTYSSLYVPLRNVSFCPLEYEFQLTEDFGMENPKGILRPNEEIFLYTWYKTEFSERPLKEEEIICRVHCFSNRLAKIGETANIAITIITQVIFSELCSFPHSYDCGEVEPGTTIKTCFYLFNFGESAVNFHLIHDHNSADVILSPLCGQCGPKQKLFVKVTFAIKNLGTNRLLISYKNRKSSCMFDTELVEEDVETCIFKIEYNCVYPVFQIVELIEHSYGHLFSKDHLWDLMKIDEINAALLEINQGEIKRVDLCLPDCVVSDDFFYLNFDIKNISSIYSRLSLKRRQVCNCKQKDSMESFTFRVKVFDCPHKNLCTISISSPNILPNSVQNLMFKIKHIFDYREMVSYIMDLSNNRTIILNIFIEGFPLEGRILSVYDMRYLLNMGYVYIGLREPPVFAFWLYNSTKHTVSFKLDDVQIIKLCNEEDFPILECLNCEGLVQPSFSAPILFKFCPIEVKTYRVSVPVSLGTKDVILSIEGHGTDNLAKNYINHFISTSPKTVFNRMIGFSVDRLITEPILVSSFTQRIIFVNNLSKTEKVQYKWKPCSVDAIVKIELSSYGGILNPKESHPIIIKVISQHEPCSIKVLLCCEFVDLDYLVVYKTLENQRRNPVPEYFHISLPITVNVIGISDRDVCLSVKDQMKLQPIDGIDIDVENFMKDYLEKTKVKERPIHEELDKKESEEAIKLVDVKDEELIKSVLEQIASEAVFSDYFCEILENRRTQPNPRYSQIKLDILKRNEQRAEEIEKLLTRPKSSEVEEIYDEIVTDAMQATFHLGSIKKKHQ